MWERACSRRGRVSRLKYRLIHRFREQARSHIFVLCQPKSSRRTWVKARALSSSPACRPSRTTH
ncbi:hypothetical protein E3Z29_04405 [Pseudomonas sp. S150]|nr:hypothetical protein E3Z29_04405 [Pseudomonas sp. S150]